MCGIAGLATADGLSEQDPGILDDMLGSLAHRGPDDQFTLGDEHALLGARRLSIIDLEGGRQPLTDESGDIIVSQNGEIYNYVELRDELLRLGHRLSTNGDTETIAHLYEEYGLEFVSRLRGMFAIALWDRRTRRLVLARDRVGKKPLYWRLHDSRLTYGSELKAILADPGTPRVVDRDALALYYRYQYVPAPRSIFEGIAKLPPASILVWEGGEPRVERYWSPTYAPKVRRDLADDAEEALALLRDSVRIRLRSDVPVGVFLSGGMDSSVVTAIASEMASTPLQTFSIGFEDRAYNELPYARQVADLFGTRHSEEIVKLDVIGALPTLATYFDEPFGDSSALPTFEVARMAGAQVKVVLTGDGGDESFGGYDRYRRYRRLAQLDGIPAALRLRAADASRAAITRIAPNHGARLRLERFRDLTRLPLDERYVAMVTPIWDRDRADLVPEPSDVETSAYLRDVLRNGPSDPTDRILMGDLLTYLPEDLLVKMDRATMANSVEARSPLLDQEVISFAARLPVDHKIDGSNGKVVLREVAKRLMPAEIIDRPKHGFSVPVGEWFRRELGDMFRDTVLSPDGLSRDFIDTSTAERWLTEHQSNRRDRGNYLWLVLTFELWARRWLGASSTLSSLGHPVALSHTHVDALAC